MQESSMPFSSVLGASSVIKPGVCTSTTRPSVPYEGQLIYETDTDRVAAYNGSAWVYTLGGLVGFANGTSTSAFSANNQLSALQLTSVPIVAGRRYMIFGTLAVQFSNSNASGKYLFLNVGSSNWTLYHIVNATTANYTITFQGSIFLTASDFGVTSGSGTATFILKWVDTANAGGLSTNPNNAIGANSSPQQLAVFDIGPSSGIISS